MTRVVEVCRARYAGLVIDVGGNAAYRFPLASKVVGWDGDIKLNLSRDRLPFDDQSVDFLFCRHTIEDMADPGNLLAEICRVAKAGYIETPSPIAEITRGVDSGGDHLGYRHHRWICWDHRGELDVLAKYPLLERLPLPDCWPDLEHEPKLWNTYFLWEGPLPYRVIEHQRGVDLARYSERSIPQQYVDLIHLACHESRLASDRLWERLRPA